MNVFFIGNVSFSRQMLEVVLENSSVNVVGIATKSASTFNSDHDDISDIAIKNNIPFKYVKDINAPHIVEWIQTLRPSVIFCFGWSNLIKQDLLTLCPYGVIGYHPAELPNNRGRHPIIWALVLGLKRTASTFFRMDSGADSGDIVNQVVLDIDYSDNSQTVYNKLIQIAKKQVEEIIFNLVNNSLEYKKQNPNEGNIWRKRGMIDGRIDWRMRSEDIYNLVRALYKPYPGAHFDYMGNQIKVWKCTPNEFSGLENIEPGKVLNCSDGKIEVKTANGSVILVEHELDLNNLTEYLL